jgi:3-oxoacyl-[acyl-carrier-protein] synthase II
LALIAARQAIDDAGYEITEANRDHIGVVLGSTMGSVHSISEFDKEGLREGPRYVNPALFPNTVINSPASQVAIRFGLRGLNSTISTGFTASMDAMQYAGDMLRLGRAEALLVGGVEELCLQTFLGFYKLGLLASAENGTPPTSIPLDRRRHGSLPGEGAAFFLLETVESAYYRGATVYAELSGYASQFHPTSLYRYDRAAIGPTIVIQAALKDAALGIESINYLSACANANKAGDVTEARAIHNVFGDRKLTTGIVKCWSGEPFSAGGALQIAETLGAIMRQQAPPTTCEELDPRASNLDCVRSAYLPMAIDHALINSFGPFGLSSAVILSRHNAN